MLRNVKVFLSSFLVLALVLVIWYMGSALAETPTLELMIQGQTGDVSDWPVRKNMHFKVRADGASAVRFQNQSGQWVYKAGSERDAAGYFTLDMILDEEGTVQVVAQAAYDGYREWLQEGFDWSQFDWSQFDWEEQGYTWSGTSNSITVNVVSHGPANAAVFSVPESVIRGEVLNITIDGAGEGEAAATDFYGYIPNNSDEMVSDVDELPVVMSFPTGNLEPGEHTVYVKSGREGYDWTTSSVTFHVSEPDETETFVLSISEPVTEGVGFWISSYEQDASRICIKIRNPEGGNDCSDLCEFHGSHGGIRHYLYATGEHEIYAEAHYEDENGNEIRPPRESEHKTVTVLPQKLLSIPVIVMDSAVVCADEDLVFRIEGLDQVPGCYWRVRAADMDHPQGNGEPTAVALWTTDDGIPSQGFRVSRDLLTTGHTYRIDVWMSKSGYGQVEKHEYFVAVEDNPEPLELRLMGQTGEITDWPVGRPVRVKLRADGASAVRFMSADGEWLYMSGYDRNGAGYFTLDSYVSSSAMIFAQAAYDGYRDWLQEDFDWSQFDWGQFDWEEQGYTWSRTSNSIVIRAVSNGPVNAAELSVPESVTRGEMLYVTITGAGEGDAAATDFSVFPTSGTSYGVSSVTEFPVVVGVPTGDLEAGEHIVSVSASREGYDSTSSSAAFRVTEPEEADAFIFSIAEPLSEGKNFCVSAYEPSASRFRLKVWNKQSDSDFEVIGDYYGNHLETSTYLSSGVYEIYAEAYYEDENGSQIREPRESEHKTVIVASEDSLNSPDIILNSSVIHEGEDVTFQIEGLEQAAGCTWTVSVEDMDAQNESGSYSIVEQWAWNETPTVPQIFTIGGNLLTAGHRYLINASVYRYGYAGAGRNASFIVTETEIPTLELTANGTDEDITDWPRNTSIAFRLKIDGATAVRYADFDGNWQTAYGYSLQGDYYTFDLVPTQTGEYTIWVQAGYDELTDWPGENYNWEAFSNAIHVSVVSMGPLEKPVYTIEKTEVKRGEPFVIHITDQGKGEFYNARLVGNGGWESASFPWNSATGMITVETGQIPAGSYRLIIQNDAQGWEGAETDPEIVTILKPEEKEIVFDAPESVLVNDDYDVSIYAPGALHVGFIIDNPNLTAEDDIWNKSYGEYGHYTTPRWFGMGDVGEHIFTAYARYEEGGEWSSVSRTVNIAGYGKLSLDTSSIPVFIPEGQPNASLSIPFPDHAEKMNFEISEYWTDEEGWHWNQLYQISDVTEGISFPIPDSSLKRGHTLSWSVNASARGYESIYTSNTVKITASNGADAELIMNVEDTTRVPVNQDIEFVVRPTNGKRISAVRFFDGYDYLEYGAEITPENHSGWFNADGDFSYSRNYEDYSFPERDYTVFAEALLEDSNEWISTNQIKFRTYVDSYVGDFGFADDSEITVSRGEMVNVTFTPSENAVQYVVSVVDNWGNWCKSQTVSDGLTATVSTADLYEGYYYFRGNAKGGAGVMGKSNTGPGPRLHVIEPSDVVVSVDKETVEVSEEFTVSAYAPGAQRVRVAHREEDNIWWDIEGSSLVKIGKLNDGIGENTFYVSAMYDGSWSAPKTIQIMLVADGEVPPPEVTFASTQIAQGQDFTFHVAMPEGAEFYSVWANRTGDGSSVYDDQDFYEDQDITISCSHLAVNDSFALTVRSNARGMQPGYFNATIRVVDGTPQAGTPTFVLPAALREIGEQAFEGISAEVVKISDTVESIGNRAFAYSSIGQVILPASLVSIADDAFEGCSMLVFAPEGSYAWNWAVNHGFDVIGH